MPRKRRNSSSASTIAASNAAPASTTSSARTPRMAPKTRLCCVTSRVPERPEIAEPQHDVQPLARDERVDERDHDRERHAEDAGAQELAPGTGEHPGGEDRDAERGEHERMLERQRGGDERAGVGGGDRRARRVQRAGGVAHRQPPLVAAGCGTRNRRSSRVAMAKWWRRTGSSKASLAAGDARRVGAGDEPHRRAPGLARGRDEPRAGRKPRGDPSARVEQREALAVVAETREDAAGLRSLLEAAGLWRAVAQPPPRTDEDAQRRIALAAAQRAARRVDTVLRQARRDGVARRRLWLLALELHGRPAARAVQERLGERPDDRGTSGVRPHSW